MVTQNESDTEGEEVAAPLPVQSTTMLSFFKRLQPAKAAEVKQPEKEKNTMQKDKKRKKGVDSDSKIVKNGASEEHQSQSPPAKKRVAEESGSVVPKKIKACKIPSSNVPSIVHDVEPTASSLIPESTPETSESGSKTKPRINSFFKPISRSDFIKESEKGIQNTINVQAMVHSPSQKAVRSTTENKSDHHQSEEVDSTAKSLCLKKAKARKNRLSTNGSTPRQSKYVRRSEETDVIDILDTETEMPETVSSSSKIQISDFQAQDLPKEKVVQDTAPENSSKTVDDCPPTTFTGISTKKMFKSKKPKTEKEKQKIVMDDGDMVDVDFQAQDVPKEKDTAPENNSNKTVDDCPPTTFTGISTKKMFKSKKPKTEKEKQKIVMDDGDMVDVDFQAQDVPKEKDTAPENNSNKTVDDCPPTTFTGISTKKMFKSKKPKTEKEKQKILMDDEDTVDVDFPSYASGKLEFFGNNSSIHQGENSATSKVLDSKKVISVVQKDEDDTVDVDFPASMAVNNDAILDEAEKACSSLQNSPIKGGLEKGVLTEANGTKTTSKPSPVKVNLFKNFNKDKKRPPKPLKGQRRSKKTKIEDLTPYDSDSIDLDYLATYNVKSFEKAAASTSVSPPGDSSSMDSIKSNGFSVLMKKPLLTKAPVFNLDDHSNPTTPPPVPNQNTTFSAVILNGEKECEVKLVSSETKVEVRDNVDPKVNAFSRLMASKGKAAKKTKANVENENIDINNVPKNNDQTKSIEEQPAPTSLVSVPSGKKRNNEMKKKRGRKPKKDVAASVETEEAPPPTEVDDILNSSAIDFVDSTTSVSVKATKVIAESPNDILNSSANDFVGHVDASESTTKVDTEEALNEIINDETTNDGQRRKSTRIRRNMILEAENQLKFAAEEESAEIEEMDIDEQKTTSQRRRKSKKSSQKRKVKKFAEKSEQSSDEEENSDSEIKIEKEILNSKVSKKPIASIFAKKGSKKVVEEIEVIEEDPAKVAARKAFLLSSVPDALKSHVDRHRRCLQDGNDEFGGAYLTPYVSNIGHVTQIQPQTGCGSLENSNGDQKSLKLRKFDNISNEQMSSTSKSMIGYYGTLVSQTKTNKPTIISLDENGREFGQFEKNQRLVASQIYCHFLAIRKSLLLDESGSAQLNATKIFRRYLERKIEADTLEEEARTKNVSLNEIEEERNKGKFTDFFYFFCFLCKAELRSYSRIFS